MSVSIRDVAERVGTGRTTVSNVLNGREGRVSPAMRSKVWQAVEELGYVPVASPISQKKRQPTRTIGVVFETFNPNDRNLGTSLFAGMMDGARQQEYDLLTLLRSPRQWNGANVEVALFDGRADGFIFVSTIEGSREATLRALVEQGTPCVAAFRRDVPEGVSTVDGDHDRAMDICIQHLLDFGHERIAFIGGDRTRHAGQRREEGFRQSMQSRGMLRSEEWMRDLGSFVPTDAEADELVQYLLDIKATAAVCAGDMVALKTWDALMRRGIRVPEEISLTGVDNLNLAEARNLTTVSIPAYGMGRVCLETCVQQLQDPTLEATHHILPVRLEVRSSTGPASTGVVCD